MNNLKNALEFHFNNGTVMAFDLSKMTSENYDKVAEAIILILGRKLQLLDSKFAKYVKKSNILAKRKFDLKLFIGGKLINATMNQKDISPSMLKDLEGLQELLYIMFHDATNTESYEVELLELTEICQN